MNILEDLFRFDNIRLSDEEKCTSRLSTTSTFDRSSYVSVIDSYGSFFIADERTDTITTRAHADTSTDSMYQLALEAEGIHEPYSNDETEENGSQGGSLFSNEGCNPFFSQGVVATEPFDHATLTTEPFASVPPPLCRAFSPVATASSSFSDEKTLAARSCWESEESAEVACNGRGRSGGAVGHGRVHGHRGGTVVNAEIGAFPFRLRVRPRQALFPQGSCASGECSDGIADGQVRGKEPLSTGCPILS
jgi:hypothetical protein